MKQQYCEYGDCKVQLETFPEIVTGLCDRHYKMLDKRHHYAVICWNCNHIHLLEASPVQDGEKLIKDKYIFTKDCPRCSQSEGNAWMNNPKQDELSDITLGPGCTLYPSPRGMVADKPGKKSLINPPRSVQATGDHFTNGSDKIIGEITLSKEYLDSIAKRMQNW